MRRCPPHRARSTGTRWGVPTALRPMRRRGGALERRMRRGTKAGEVQCLVAEGGNGEGLRRWGCQAGSIDQLERTRGEIAGESGAIGGLGRPPGQMNWSEMGARRGAAPGRAPPQRRLPGMFVGLSALLI